MKIKDVILNLNVMTAVLLCILLESQLKPFIIGAG